jgi:Nif-specific regulatory protein
MACGMNDVLSPVRILTGMARALPPVSSLSEDAPPGGNLSGLLAGMLDVLVRGTRAARAVLILLDPDDEVPLVRAAVPDAGDFEPRGESLREFLHPGPPRLTPADGPEGADGTEGRVFVGRPGGPLAVVPFGVAGEDGRELRGALAVEFAAGDPAVAALPGAAALVARAVEWRQGVSALRDAHAAETAALRGRVSAGFGDAFGPGGCPGLAAARPAVELAAREAGPVFFQGEAGTGKARLARIVHDLSRRGTRPFAVARAADMEAVFGLADGGFARPGAVEDAAGGTLYLADAEELAAGPDHAGQARVARLALQGLFSRCGSGLERRANVRVILGSGLSPRELAGLVPALAPLVTPGAGGADALRVIRLPALRERPGDVPILLQRAVELLAGRAGVRPSFTPRAVKALCAYPWPGNDEEVRALTAETLVSRSGDRVDVEDLPSRVFSLATAGSCGNGGPPAAAEAGEPEGEADTLWDMERARVRAALDRHGWVRARAARELGLTPRQLGWRMKRHGLTRGGG